ncbi:MAG: hypothetical protein ACK41Q_07275 [Candidatus Brocadia sp.]
MIKDAEYLRKFEEEFTANRKMSYEQALNIVDAMWEEGVSLGVLPPKDLMEGIEVDIKIAKVLNACLKNC